MSWNAYSDLVISSKNAQKAGVYGQDGATWGVSGGLAGTVDEIKALVAICKAGSSSSGIVFEGKKYMFLNGVDGVVRGKAGDAGIAAAVTNSAIVVGTYTSGSSPPQCSNAVENCAAKIKQANM